MHRWVLGILLIAFPGCASAATTPATTKAQKPLLASPRTPVKAAPVFTKEVVTKKTDEPAASTTAQANADAALKTSTPSASADSALATADTASDDPDEDLDDDIDEAADAGAEEAEEPQTTKPSPLLALTATELEARYKKEPASVGPLSLGAPNAGALVNGVQMPKSEKWLISDPSCAWGTQETIDAISRSIEKVWVSHPGAPPLAIGHISARKGGHLSPHRSHQAGRDVDLGYYHSPAKTSFVRATETNIDIARTYAFVKTIVTETDTELVLIDTSIQRMLVSYGMRTGEDEAWLDQVFQVRNKHPRPLVRHAHGHANHLHVRFVSPVAQTLGHRAEAFLKREKVAPPHISESVVLHKAHSGDTLVILAKRYGTSVDAIRSANGLKTIDIKMGRTYKIPVPVSVAAKVAAPKRVFVPKRRVPNGRKRG